MTSITQLVDTLRDTGMTDEEIDANWQAELAAADQMFQEAYNDDPIVQDGWHQQDIIEMRRREQ